MIFYYSVACMTGTVPVMCTILNYSQSVDVFSKAIDVCVCVCGLMHINYIHALYCLGVGLGRVTHITQLLVHKHVYIIP